MLQPAVRFRIWLWHKLYIYACFPNRLVLIDHEHCSLKPSSDKSLTISQAVFEQSIKGNKFDTWASLEALDPHAGHDHGS